MTIAPTACTTITIVVTDSTGYMVDIANFGGPDATDAAFDFAFQCVAAGLSVATLGAKGLTAMELAAA